MKNRVAMLLTFAAAILLTHVPLDRARGGEPEFVESVEEDLHDPDGGKTFRGSVLKRIDPSKYGEFVLQWQGRVENTACLVYHAEDPDQDEETWGTKTKNIAVKLVKMDGSWVVHALNIKPGDDVASYDIWLEAQGCKKS